MKFGTMSNAQRVFLMRRALGLLIEQVAPEAREVRIPIRDLTEVDNLGIDITKGDDGELMLVLALGDKR